MDTKQPLSMADVERIIPSLRAAAYAAIAIRLGLELYEVKAGADQPDAISVTQDLTYKYPRTRERHAAMRHTAICFLARSEAVRVFLGGGPSADLAESDLQGALDALQEYPVPGAQINDAAYDLFLKKLRGHARYFVKKLRPEILSITRALDGDRVLSLEQALLAYDAAPREPTQKKAADARGEEFAHEVEERMLRSKRLNADDQNGDTSQPAYCAACGNLLAPDESHPSQIYKGAICDGCFDLEK